MCSTIFLLLRNIYLCIEKSVERGENGEFSLFFNPSELYNFEKNACKTFYFHSTCSLLF